MVSIDVACFTFDALVCPITVLDLSNSSPGRYSSPPVEEVSSPRSDILSPAASRARDDLPSSEASSSSAAS